MRLLILQINIVQCTNRYINAQPTIRVFSVVMHVLEAFSLTIHVLRRHTCRLVPADVSERCYDMAEDGSNALDKKQLVHNHPVNHFVFSFRCVRSHHLDSQAELKLFVLFLNVNLNL